MYYISKIQQFTLISNADTALICMIVLYLIQVRTKKISLTDLLTKHDSRNDVFTDISEVWSFYRWRNGQGSICGSN